MLKLNDDHVSEVFCAYYTPDGSKIVTGNWDNTAEVWNPTTGEHLLDLVGHDGPVRCVSISPDGARIATGSDDKTAIIWDAITGAKLVQLSGHSDSVTGISFSPDGARIATASMDGELKLWDASSGKTQLTIPGPGFGLKSVSFSPDGQRLVAGAVEKAALLWDVQTGNSLRTFSGHDDAVNCATFSPDGRMILTASDDSTARLWDAASGKELRQLRDHAAGVTTAQFSLDGRRIVTASRDGTIRVWDVATGKTLMRTGGTGARVWTAAFSPHDDRILTSSGDSTSRIWDSSNGKEVLILRGHEGTVRSAAYSVDGTKVATASWDGTARLWDATSGREILRVGDSGIGLETAAFSTDGAKLVTAGNDHTARIWSTVTGTELVRLAGHGDLVTYAEFSPDDSKVVTSSFDKTAKVWDSSTGGLLFTLSGHTDLVWSASFSPDGSKILTASWDGTAKVWDAKTGSALLTLAGHRYVVWTAFFSPDGTSIVTSSGDKTARIWDASTGQERLAIEIGNEITCARYSHDGTKIVTASVDGTCQVWDARTGREFGRIVPLGDLGWACVTPQGWFDASPGALHAMYWVLPETLETIDLEQIKERNWKPGLLRSIIRGDTLPEAPTFPVNRLQPIASIQAPAAGSTLAHVHLKLRSGGLGRVTVYIGDTPIELDPASQHGAPGYSAMTLTVDLKNYVVAGKENTLWAKVRNSDGSLTANTTVVTFTPKPSGSQVDTLYVLAVGAGDFESPTLHLNLPPKDAADIVKAAILGGNRLFQGRVRATLLTTDPSYAQGVKGLSIGEPTKQGIHEAFEEIEKDATPSDTVLVFFAGHGVTYKRGDSTFYCFLTSDATTADMQDPDVRARQGVSMEDLVQWMAPGRDKESGIRAQRRVLILDTCSAGEAVANLALQRGSDQDVVKAHELFKDKTGFWVLAGSAADAVSYEAGEFGHGLLTYSLLLGLSGAGLHGERAEVESLFTFAKGEVESLVQGRLGAVQIPQVFAMNTSFPIGLFNEEDRRQVTPGEARIRILRPESLVDKDKGYDSLNLTKTLKDMLEDQNRTLSRGENVKTWFVDADELSGALTPAGSYSVSPSGRIVLSLVLLNRSRAKPEVARQTVEGDSGNLRAFCKKVLDALNDAASSVKQP